MQALRDNPECAREEYSRLLDAHDPGLACRVELRSGRRRRRALHRAAAHGPRSRCCANRASTARPKWRAVFTRAGFDAYDVHMTDILTRRVRLVEIPRPGRLRRLLLRRRARCGRRLGEIDPLQSVGARRVQRLLRARRDVHARRVQRLPNALGAQGADSGHRELAALRAQPLRAVRGAPESRAGAAIDARCCSPACTARCCRLRWRTGRGWRSSRAARAPTSCSRTAW